MARKLSNRIFTNEQFVKGQEWAATQHDPRLQYLSTLRHGDPLRVGDLDGHLHDNCVYLGLRPLAKNPVIVKHREQVFGVDTMMVLRAEADVPRGQLPGGEILHLCQPISSYKEDRICNCDHEWIVNSATAESWLVVICFHCDAHGSVDDPTTDELLDALDAESKPYVWPDKSRVTVRGCLDESPDIIPIDSI